MRGCFRFASSDWEMMTKDLFIFFVFLFFVFFLFVSFFLFFLSFLLVSRLVFSWNST